MLQPFSQNKKINWAAGSAKPVNLKWFKRNSRGSKKLKAFLHAGIAGPIFVLNIYTPRAQEVILDRVCLIKKEGENLKSCLNLALRFCYGSFSKRKNII